MVIYKLLMRNLPEAYLHYSTTHRTLHFAFWEKENLHEVLLSEHRYAERNIRDVSDLQKLFRYLFNEEVEVQEVSSLPTDKRNISSRVPDKHFPYLIPLLFYKNDLIREPLIIKNCFSNTPPDWFTFENIPDDASLEITSNSLLILCSTCKHLKGFNKVLAKISQTLPSHEIVINKKSLEVLSYLKKQHSHIYESFLKNLEHSYRVTLFPPEDKFNISEDEKEVLNEVLSKISDYTSSSEETNPQIFLIIEDDTALTMKIGERYANLLSREVKKNIIKKAKTAFIKDGEIKYYFMYPKYKIEYLILPWILQESGSDRNALLRSYLETYSYSYTYHDDIEVILKSDLKNEAVFEKEIILSDLNHLAEKLMFWLTEVQTAVKNSNDRRIIIHYLSGIVLESFKDNLSSLVNTLRKNKLPTKSLNFFISYLYITASTDKIKYSKVIDTLKHYVFTKKGCISECINWIEYLKRLKNHKSDYRLFVPKDVLEKIPPDILQKLAKAVLEHNTVEVEDKDEFLKRLRLISITNQEILLNLENINTLMQTELRKSAVRQIASLTLEDPLKSVTDYERVRLENILYNSFFVFKEAEKIGLDLRKTAEFIAKTFRVISTGRNPHYFYIPERNLKEYENRIQKDPDELKMAVTILQLIEKAFKNRQEA